jgi:tetratricopeptide (TPR) repeat protein
MDPVIANLTLYGNVRWRSGQADQGIDCGPGRQTHQTNQTKRRLRRCAMVWYKRLIVRVPVTGGPTMTGKNHSVVPKNTERRTTKPQAAKPAAADPEEAPVSSRVAAAALAQTSNPQKQRSCFEAAMKLFHARQFREARELFVSAAGGTERDVAQRSRLHISMCDRRLEQAPVNLLSAEDYYNYGVALINTRNVTEARVHLEKALEISPDADHIHYALALALALGGDHVHAFESLKRSIELEPRNRIIARQDQDFAPLARQSPFDALLYPEKKGW